jgi:hypothetical protein
VLHNLAGTHVESASVTGPSSVAAKPVGNPKAKHHTLVMAGGGPWRGVGDLMVVLHSKGNTYLSGIVKSDGTFHLLSGNLKGVTVAPVYERDGSLTLKLVRK